MAGSDDVIAVGSGSVVGGVPLTGLPICIVPIGGRSAKGSLGGVGLVGLGEPLIFLV